MKIITSNNNINESVPQKWKKMLTCKNETLQCFKNGNKNTTQYTMITSSTLKNYKQDIKYGDDR